MTRLRGRTRGAAGGADERAVAHDEGGFTLVEALITSAVMVVVIASVVPVVQIYFAEQLAVQRTYSGADQILLSSEVMTRYIREMVEPAPPVAGVPTPPFASATSCAATFYADVGNANGPDKVIAAATPCTGTGQTFLMTITAPDANSCPVTGSTGTACTYTTHAPRRVVSITNMINNTTPVFTYTLQGGSTTATAGTTCSTSDSWSCTTPSTSCTSGAGNCQLDEVIAVTVNIQADMAPGSPSGFQTLAYALAPGYDVVAG